MEITTGHLINKRRPFLFFFFFFFATSSVPTIVPSSCASPAKHANAASDRELLPWNRSTLGIAFSPISAIRLDLALTLQGFPLGATTRVSICSWIIPGISTLRGELKHRVDFTTGLLAEIVLNIESVIHGI
jgi:hypothetical protein